MTDSIGLHDGSLSRVRRINEDCIGCSDVAFSSRMPHSSVVRPGSGVAVNPLAELQNCCHLFSQDRPFLCGLWSLAIVRIILSSNRIILIALFACCNWRDEYVEFFC